jgi:plasmid rolling circle replication initiator protein Rep
MQENPLIMLHGKGSDLTNLKAVQRRAKCKLITQITMLQLIDIAKEKGAKDRVKAYWNTYHCHNLVYTSDDRMYATQCKNRFCTYCCGIRKAELIKKYLPVLQTWEQPFFVTLTTKAVGSGQLQKRIKETNNALRLIIDKYKKKSQRGRGVKLMGLKAIECNFNPKNRTYNPHLHLIVPNKQMAEILVNEWLNHWTSKVTHRDAQHYRKVENKEKDLIEVIKYETKVFTEPDGKKSKGKKGSAKIYIRALYNIHVAMKGIRLIDRFGFNAPKTGKPKYESRLTDDYVQWQYDLKSRDWLTEEHESTLTAFTPEPELETILELNINTELE